MLCVRLILFMLHRVCVVSPKCIWIRNDYKHTCKLNARRWSFETLSGVKRNDKTNSNNNSNMKHRDDDDDKNNRNKRTNTFLLYTFIYAPMAGRNFHAYTHEMLLLQSLLLSPSSQPKKTTRIDMKTHKHYNMDADTSAPCYFFVSSSSAFPPVYSFVILCSLTIDKRTRLHASVAETQMNIERKRPTPHCKCIRLPHKHA